MSKPVPIYRNAEQKAQADACVPLVDAVKRGEVRLEALVHGHYPGRPLPAGALPGMQTVGYWDAQDSQNWGLPWHRNEGIELTFLESGKIAFSAEERDYELLPGDLTVTRPWQSHRLGRPNIGAGRLHWMIIDVRVRRPNQAWRWPSWLMLSRHDLSELTDILQHNEQPVWKASADVRRCFQKVACAVESDREGSSISRLTVRINELFILLLDMFRGQEIRLNPSLSSSRRTVELFLADLSAHKEHVSMEWTVAEMADSCGLGVTQFIHHVRALTNLTPIKYLKLRRLDMAAELLRARPGHSVTDVSHDCGFSSSQYFATAFHQRFGCSPRNFRASQIS
jgi:AraC-like DNA-binding protein